MGGHVFWCTMKHLPWKYEFPIERSITACDVIGGGTRGRDLDPNVLSDTLASFLHKIETSSIFTSAVGIDGSFRDVLLTLFVHASTSCDEINVYLINNPTGTPFNMITHLPTLYSCCFNRWHLYYLTASVGRKNDNHVINQTAVHMRSNVISISVIDRWGWTRAAQNKILHLFCPCVDYSVRK